MLGEKAEVVPIECVARGYLAGSGWKEYRQSAASAASSAAGLRQWTASRTDLHAGNKGIERTRHQYLV